MLVSRSSLTVEACGTVSISRRGRAITILASGTLFTASLLSLVLIKARLADLTDITAYRTLIACFTRLRVSSSTRGTS